jgi:flavodoxin
MNDDGKPSAQVIYYSRTGKTRLIAEAVKDQLNCDLLEVIDQKDRSGIWGFIGGVIDVRFRPGTSITPSEFDFTSYDLLIVCTPVWGMTFPPAINTFFTKAKLEDKKVVLLADFTGRMRDGTFDEYRDRIRLAGGELIARHKIATGRKQAGMITREAAQIAAEKSSHWLGTGEADQP